MSIIDISTEHGIKTSSQQPHRYNPHTVPSKTSKVTSMPMGNNSNPNATVKSNGQNPNTKSGIVPLHPKSKLSSYGQSHSRQKLLSKPVYLSFSKARFLITDTPTDSNMARYLDTLKRKHVKYVVRLCEPTYDISTLLQAGIQVIDMPFIEDSINEVAVPREIYRQWVKLIYEVFPKFGLTDVHQGMEQDKDDLDQEDDRDESNGSLAQVSEISVGITSGNGHASSAVTTDADKNSNLLNQTFLIQPNCPCCRGSGAVQHQVNQSFMALKSANNINHPTKNEILSDMNTNISSAATTSASMTSTASSIELPSLKKSQSQSQSPTNLHSPSSQTNSQDSRDSLLTTTNSPASSLHYDDKAILSDSSKNSSMTSETVVDEVKAMQDNLTTITTINNTDTYTNTSTAVSPTITNTTQHNSKQYVVRSYDPSKSGVQIGAVGAMANPLPRKTRNSNGISISNINTPTTSFHHNPSLDDQPLDHEKSILLSMHQSAPLPSNQALNSSSSISISRYGSGGGGSAGMYESCMMCASIVAQVGYHPPSKPITAKQRMENNNQYKNTSTTTNNNTNNTSTLNGKNSTKTSYNPHIDEDGNEKVTIAVHCVSGVSRSPLFIAIALLEAGFTIDETLTICRTKSKGSISPIQMNFLLHYKVRKNPTLRQKNNKKGNGNGCCTVM